MGRAFTPEQDAYILSPEYSVLGFEQRWPGERSVESIARHHRRLRLSKRAETPAPMRSRPETPEVIWDKQEIDFHWTDVLDPLIASQGDSRNASGAQDRAYVRINTDQPVPVLFISDWHVGSWGTSYRQVAEITQTIQRLGLKVVVLGDMLQMSIKLRNVLEISDNALTPRRQFLFHKSWLEDMHPHILCSTWDNHVVMREEAVTGFSWYAEMYREKTIYFSGIGHIDIGVGEQEYHMAVSHRFRGRSELNPVHAQMKYMRFQGQDREIAVAGDSHLPALMEYTDGPTPRVAINCGALQTNSGYAKRFYSLSTHDWMPLVVFYPDEHLMVPYSSLTKYLRTIGEEKTAA